MSRSNQTEQTPNPSTRWMEWSGSNGNLKYFDRNAKVNVDIDLPFEFILLDQLSCVKGWSDDSDSGIFSNEVRSTIDEPFVVKAFKQREPIAEGFYANIKDKVKASGGHYVANCYIAFTDDNGKLALGSLQFHGAALNAWFEFAQDKTNRGLLYKSGIRIGECKTGKKGSITFKVPVFKLVELPQEANDEATALDVDLQNYLRSYFKRSRVEQVEPETSVEDEDDAANRELAEAGVGLGPDPDDNLPF